MNKFLISAAGALCASATQVAHEPLFLQGEVTDVQRASSTTGCQFVTNYNWYNYIDTTGNTAYAYES